MLCMHCSRSRFHFFTDAIYLQLMNWCLKWNILINHPFKIVGNAIECPWKSIAGILWRRKIPIFSYPTWYNSFLSLAAIITAINHDKQFEFNIGKSSALFSAFLKFPLEARRYFDWFATTRRLVDRIQNWKWHTYHSENPFTHMLNMGVD